MEVSAIARSRGLPPLSVAATAFWQCDAGYTPCPHPVRLPWCRQWRYTQAMSREFRLDRTPADVLDYEIAQEQAVALGRLGRALEDALARLREYDAAHPRSGAPESARQARRTLVMEAGHALWMFVVQREACGLRDARTVMRDYGVPREVQRQMGAGAPSRT